MKKKFDLKFLTTTAVLAALYLVLCVAIQPLSYGAIQIRFAEVLALLPFFNKRFSWAVILGCGMANLFSTLGPIDMIFGVGATIICALIVQRMPNILLAGLAITIINGFIVGFELSLVFQTPMLFNVVTVAAGEAIAMLVGIVFWKVTIKNPRVRQIIQPRDGLKV